MTSFQQTGSNFLLHLHKIRVISNIGDGSTNMFPRIAGLGKWSVYPEDKKDLQVLFPQSQQEDKSSIFDQSRKQGVLN